MTQLTTTYYSIDTFTMITVIHHAITRSIQSSLIENKGTIAIEDWPVKDRIAHFERQAALHAASTYTKNKHFDCKPIAVTDECVVNSFLESIGQKAASPQSFPPQLKRLANEWNNKVQERLNQQKWDDQFYSLSEKLSRVDSTMRSPDIARLEMEGVDLLACAESSDKKACDEDFDEDIVEDKRSFFTDVSTELPALESGLVELSKEIELFR